jgi:hypothetical protein
MLGDIGNLTQMDTIVIAHSFPIPMFTRSKQVVTRNLKSQNKRLCLLACGLMLTHVDVCRDM